MGIKFHCPNGHKLNVKAFLAGKRGICPHCGCKMEIPLESQRGPDAKKKVTSDPAETMPAAATAASPAVAVASVPAASVPAATAPVASAPAATVPVASAPAATVPAATVPAADVPQAAPLVAAAPSDPITEAPQALWYVRPTTGGQYGPASGDAMRGWIDEGRVNGQSLIWREGWPEWKKADGVFRQLAQPAANTTAPMTAPMSAPMTAAPAMPIPSVNTSGPASVAPTPPSGSSSVGRADESRPVVRRRKSNLTTIVAVAVMTLLLALSAVILFFVMRDS
jgi:hypothetical protein